MEVRSLVESYYDIQKLRLQTFTRIVNWVKENKNEILEALSQSGNEAQAENASQIFNEAQKNSASHSNIEAHNKDASHHSDETHKVSASQSHYETQGAGASHFCSETQKINASQNDTEAREVDASQTLLETQEVYASQCRFETQKGNASQFVCETHASDASHRSNETHKVTASQGDGETQGRSASHLKFETHVGGANLDFAKVLILNKKYAEFAKRFILSQDLNETQLDFAFFDQIKYLAWYHNKLYETEKELAKAIDKLTKNHPLRQKFLDKVKGIGPVLAAGLIAYLASERVFTIPKVIRLEGRTVWVKRKDRIEEQTLPEYAKILEYNKEEQYLRVWMPEVMREAKTISQLWRYSGFAPGQRRQKGKKTDYNPRVKTLCWKVGESFIKCKCFGRRLYDRAKTQLKAKHPDWNNAKCHAFAKRKVVKIFLGSLWMFWRKMMGLPITQPYPQAHLGHQDIYTPEHWMEK